MWDANQLLRLTILGVVLSLATGCAAVDRIETAYTAVTTATVSPTQVKLAIDAFDAAEVTATDFYLPLHPCKVHAAPCRGAAKPVIDAIRAGRSARNNLKAVLRRSADGPISAVDYNALAVATGTIKAALSAYGINF